MSAMTAGAATAIPRTRRPASRRRSGCARRARAQTVIHDRVQGDVTVGNQQLDDLIILRSDGTPTYNLSVVVDDHDMGITHVIRGDDHLNNAFRQTQIYRALGWGVPEFAHVPLIHGADGAKLSKRHGALGVEAYRDMGYLPEALRNYLLRLGWSHGDDEIIATADAIRWFDLDAVGRAPARFDFLKLGNLNGHYIRAATDGRLAALVADRLERTLDHALDDAARRRLALRDARPEAAGEDACRARRQSALPGRASADPARRQGAHGARRGGARAARRARRGARRSRLDRAGARGARRGALPKTGGLPLPRSRSRCARRWWAQRCRRGFSR